MCFALSACPALSVEDLSGCAWSWHPFCGGSSFFLTGMGGMDEQPADLRGLLREIKLEAKLADAQAWCAEEEVDSLASLAGYVKDKAIADSLIGRLQIKPGKAKARELLELIAKRASSQPAGPVQMLHVKRQVSDQI